MIYRHAVRLCHRNWEINCFSLEKSKYLFILFQYQLRREAGDVLVFTFLVLTLTSSMLKYFL